MSRSAPVFTLVFNDPNPDVLRADVLRNGSLYGHIWVNASRPTALQEIEDSAQKIVNEAAQGYSPFPMKPAGWMDSGSESTEASRRERRRERNLRVRLAERDVERERTRRLEEAFAEIRRQCRG